MCISNTVMLQIFCTAVSLTVRHIVHFNTPLYLKQHTLYLEWFIYILYIEMKCYWNINWMKWTVNWKQNFLLWSLAEITITEAELTDLLTYLIIAWPYGPLRAVSALTTDTYSSLSTAFRCHFFTLISRRSFCKSSKHSHLGLPFFYFPQVYSQMFS